MNWADIELTGWGRSSRARVTACRPERAAELSAAGDHALACHLAEWAGRAAPEDEAIRKARAEVYRRRAEVETSLMAQNIYRSAADRDQG